MRPKFFLNLLVLSALLVGMNSAYCQTNQNQTTTEKTIRVKMVKNINGVETVFDTTIVGGEWTDIQGIHDMPQIEIEIDSVHSMEGGNHIIVKTIDINGMNDSNVVIRIIEGDDPEMDKIMIIEDDEKENANSQGKTHKMEVRVVIKNCNTEDLNKDDRKQLKDNGRLSNDNLKVDQVNFYPNPNNGRFNLGFTLPKQGETQVLIFNMEGKNGTKRIFLILPGHIKTRLILVTMQVEFISSK